MTTALLAEATESVCQSAALGRAGRAVDDEGPWEGFTRWESGPNPGQRIGVSSLQLSGLRCAACSTDIERALLRLPGVLGAQVNAAAQRASVRWDPTRTRISAVLFAVVAAGYGAAPDLALPARRLRAQERRHALWRLFVASFLAMQVMMLATPAYVAGPVDLSDDLRRLLNWAQWLLSVPVLVFSAGPFFSGAWRAFRARRIGMDLPVALGLAVCFGVSSVVTFQARSLLGDEVYFDSLTMFVAFLCLGRWLEMQARHRAAEALEASLKERPVLAWRIEPGGQLLEVAAQRLRLGDRVRVPLGAAVPADGTLISASAAVEEALLTGEAQAVAKQAGEALLAGSINLVQPFDMLVTAVGGDTRQAQMAALVREALACRPPLVRLADRWAGPFLWAVVALALTGGLAWLWIDPSRAAWVMVSVLIVTCPCALSLATPATWVAATAGLARRGVLLRRLDALQTAAKLNRLLLDKTGTLTEAEPKLLGVQWPAQGQELDQADRAFPAGSAGSPGSALAAALSLAQQSLHPLAKALAAQLPHLYPGTAQTFELTGVAEEPGLGLLARDSLGRTWRLGSERWALQAPQQRLGASAHLHLSCDGRAAVAFVFAEALRSDALALVCALKQRGIALTLLSGDQAQRSERVAQALGISDVVASASPQDKLDRLRASQLAGEVTGMLGDGVNDAPVLAGADLSIALAQGAAVSQRQADAVAVGGELAAVVDLIDTGLKSLHIVRQNLAWAALYNAVCIPAALLGYLPPWAAGLGMALSSLAVVLNAQRAARA